MPIFDSSHFPNVRKPLKPNPRRKSLIGQRFGNLTPFGFLGIELSKKQQAIWLFRCDCGNFFYTCAADVLSNRIVSCGCRKVSGDSQRTHGMRRGADGKTPKEYNTWCNVVYRIESENFIQSANYGGRGITICAHLRQFTGFFEVLGKCPPNKTSIDRINPEGHYSCGTCPQCLENQWPLNVRWADKWEQGGNRRNNHRIAFNGETLHLAEWSRRTNVSASKIRNRIKLGWTLEETFETVPRQRQPNLNR